MKPRAGTRPLPGGPGAADGRVEATAADGIGRLVFVNPAKRNALSTRMMLDAATVLDRFREDDRIRAVILSGAGDTFASGADLGEAAATGPDGQHTRPVTPEGAGRLFSSLDAFDRPLLAMIRGHCLGAGVAVALRADIRIATEDSVFGIPAARVGIGYPVPEVESLVAAVGPGAASDLLFTARRIDGVEAHRIGLVTRLTRDGDLDDEVAKAARTIAANAPLSVRAAKATIAAVVGGNRAPALEHAQRLIDLCSDSADAREGALAFVQRRAPEFRGR
ncbi:enoyl-CoA hydratase-related protein [Streptomyces sp. NPDC046909]|uniref:enoyl-CoA hydratase-related protein n=1 Tax=Streptomyces sp. NPDC046909 TaxID=3155617 RepID=UPI003401DF4F